LCKKMRERFAERKRKPKTSTSRGGEGAAANGKPGMAAAGEGEAEADRGAEEEVMGDLVDQYGEDRAEVADPDLERVDDGDVDDYEVRHWRAAASLQ
jgi:hypothetical protein